MSISFYEMPPGSPDDVGRYAAVAHSGALQAMGDPVLDQIVREARNRLRGSHSLVSILQDDYQHLIAADGVELGVYSRRTSFCGHAAASGSTLFCIPNLATDPRFLDNPYANGVLARHRFYAGAVLVDEGVTLGSLGVLDSRPRAGLAPEEGALLRRMGDAVVARLGRLRLGLAA